MKKRFVSIWFRHLRTDWFSIRQPTLKSLPFVLRTSSHGRMIISATNDVAERKGIEIGMPLADAKAMNQDLEIRDDQPDLSDKLLTRLAEWCIRFTPVAAIDPPDGLLLDVTGCAHLWGDEHSYLECITQKVTSRGYSIRIAIADTPGVAWGVARYGCGPFVVPNGRNVEALSTLPPEALRLEPDSVERLHKLGLHNIHQFENLSRSSLRRRFGQQLINQLDFALGRTEEILHPVKQLEPYQERLPCLEPIVTATGIDLALQQLLAALCNRLQQDQKGLRSAVFKGYRVDGKIECIDIVTNRPSHHCKHLSKLFDIKLSTMEPALGIELFTLDAPKIEELLPQQEKMWEGSGGLDDIRLSELLDRLAGRYGMNSIHRYLPDEHHWPERSIKQASSLQENSTTAWRSDKLRPLQLLRIPERVEVTAPIPDYPPMLFRYKGKLHKIVRADGPERIEQEWWLGQGQHRDYYRVEDEDGQRYWLFRLGHYHDKNFQWFLHGFFA
jgi:protein ImuB